MISIMRREVDATYVHARVTCGLQLLASGCETPVGAAPNLFGVLAR